MGCSVVIELSSPVARPGAYLVDLELVTMALLSHLGVGNPSGICESDEVTDSRQTSPISQL